MNAILREIIETGMVRDGEERIKVHSEMSEAEGDLITRVFREVKPDTSVEIGLAYGVSALYACDALRANGKPSRHILLDPSQHESWRGIGLRNLRDAGFEDLIEFRGEASEFGLPKLVQEGVRAQVAIIDGWHTFDHTLIDFFYCNRLLDVGGVIVLDDTNLPSVTQVAEHIRSYPAYRVYEGEIKGRTTLGRIRHSIGDRLKSSVLRKHWDYPSCMAFQKVAEDERPWNWYAPF